MSNNLAIIVAFALDIAMLLGMIYLGWPITGIILFLICIPHQTKTEENEKD